MLLFTFPPSPMYVGCSSIPASEYENKLEIKPIIIVVLRNTTRNKKIWSNIVKLIFFMFSK